MATANMTATKSNQQQHEGQIHLAQLMLDLVETPITIVIFLLIVTLVKAAYYRSKKLQTYVPESSILIACGLLLGIVLYFGFPHQIPKWTLTTETLFLVMLPPIMLESAFGLYDRTFFDNIGSILLFAVVGTFMAFVFIGVGCWGVASAGWMGMELSLLPSLLFSSFIVAVDPVAVLAIFQDIGVDRRLYLLVFGESLLNDGVTVVLYTVMKALCSMTVVGVDDVFMGVASFFIVTIGGLFIGTILGALSSLLLKFVWRIRVMEISILLGFAYLSYLLAMLFDWSGIISIISCGLMQMRYAMPTLHVKSRTTVKYLVKLLALLSESLIFLYLGVELMTDLFGNDDWNIIFSLWELFFCIISRFLVVISLTAILNHSTHRLKKVSLTEQIILAYGGLRGAIAFALATTLDAGLLERYNLNRRTFNAATLFIILITTVLFGLLTKPLVKFLKIRLEPHKQLSLISEFNDHLTDHMKHGIESIIGRNGSAHSRNVIATIDDFLIKPVLQRQPLTRSDEMMMRFEKVAMKIAYASLMPEKDVYLTLPRAAASYNDTMDSDSNARSRSSIAADWVIRQTRADEGSTDDLLDVDSSYHDLADLTSNDEQARSRGLSKLHNLMRENAPSGVPRAKWRRDVVEDEVPEYLQELKRKRRVMYLLYKMQQRTMSRTASRASLSETATIASMSLPRPAKKPIKTGGARYSGSAGEYASYSLPRASHRLPPSSGYASRTLDRASSKRPSEVTIDFANRTPDTICEGVERHFHEVRYRPAETDNEDAAETAVEQTETSPEDDNRTTEKTNAQPETVTVDVDVDAEEGERQHDSQVEEEEGEGEGGEDGPVSFSVSADPGADVNPSGRDEDDVDEADRRQSG